MTTATPITRRKMNFRKAVLRKGAPVPYRRARPRGWRRTALPDRGRLRKPPQMVPLPPRPLEEPRAIGLDAGGVTGGQVLTLPRVGGEVEELRAPGLELVDELPGSVPEA